MENHDKVGLALKKLLKLLKCCVCYEYMQSPIYQCENGHTLCSGCKGEWKGSCPSCRGRLSDIRCLALEEVAESLVVNCKYKKFGCGELLPYSAKLAHEEDGCEFRPRRPYACPCSFPEGSCDVAGDIPFLISHMTDHHDADMLIDTCEFIRIYHFDEIYGVTIINCLGKYFTLHMESYYEEEEEPVFVVYMVVMGKEAEAREYRYRLKISIDGGRLIIEGPPRGLRETPVEVDCPGPLIRTGDGRREIKITGLIWKAA